MLQLLLVALLVPCVSASGQPSTYITPEPVPALNWPDIQAGQVQSDPTALNSAAGSYGAYKESAASSSYAGAYGGQEAAIAPGYGVYAATSAESSSATRRRILQEGIGATAWEMLTVTTVGGYGDDSLTGSYSVTEAAAAGSYSAYGAQEHATAWYGGRRLLEVGTSDAAAATAATDSQSVLVLDVPDSFNPEDNMLQLAFTGSWMHSSSSSFNAAFTLELVNQDGTEVLSFESPTLHHRTLTNSQHNQQRKPYLLSYSTTFNDVLLVPGEQATLRLSTDESTISNLEATILLTWRYDSITESGSTGSYGSPGSYGDQEFGHFIASSLNVKQVKQAGTGGGQGLYMASAVPGKYGGSLGSVAGVQSITPNVMPGTAAPEPTSRDVPSAHQQLPVVSGGYSSDNSYPQAAALMKPTRTTDTYSNNDNYDNIQTALASLLGQPRTPPMLSSVVAAPTMRSPNLKPTASTPAAVAPHLLTSIASTTPPEAVAQNTGGQPQQSNPVLQQAAAVPIPYNAFGGGDSSTGCFTKIPRGLQCGGTGGSCAQYSGAPNAAACRDETYPGACCASGTECVRKSAEAWFCAPSHGFKRKLMA